MSAQTATAGGSYTVACGTGGSATLIQTQLTAIAGTTGNSLTVTGTCSGTLTISDFDQLNISGLNLSGSLVLSTSQNVNVVGSTINGTIIVIQTGSTQFTNTTLNGSMQVVLGSRVNVSQLTQNPGTDSTGALAQGITCISLSNCYIDGFTLRGTPSTASGAPAPGAITGSGSTLILGSGTITGFDIGVQAWDHAVALFEPSCANFTITGNTMMGVYVRDSGLVKATGSGPAGITSSCPGQILISSNGQYGVRSEGMGNAYLYEVQISGHSIDSILVQDGASAKVMSSTIDAASSTGRAARVRAQSILWFDEEQNGPSARSVLRGPVCVVGNSYVDTNNSSTQVMETHGSCGS